MLGEYTNPKRREKTFKIPIGFFPLHEGPLLTAPAPKTAGKRNLARPSKAANSGRKISSSRAAVRQQLAKNTSQKTAATEDSSSRPRRNVRPVGSSRHLRLRQGQMDHSQVLKTDIVGFTAMTGVSCLFGHFYAFLSYHHRLLNSRSDKT